MLVLHLTLYLKPLPPTILNPSCNEFFDLIEHDVVQVALIPDRPTIRKTHRVDCNDLLVVTRDNRADEVGRHASNAQPVGPSVRTDINHQNRVVALYDRVDIVFASLRLFDDSKTGLIQLVLCVLLSLANAGPAAVLCVVQYLHPSAVKLLGCAQRLFCDSRRSGQ